MLPRDLAGGSSGQGGQADGGIIAECSDGFQGHVAGALYGPFIDLFQEYGTDEVCNDRLGDVAKLDFEWAVAIDRKRLRPRYREGFGRLPLNLRWQPDLRAPAEGGADGPAHARPFP